MDCRLGSAAVLGIAAALGWTLGCGGGGGGGSSGAQIIGSLSRSSAVRIASLGPRPGWGPWAIGFFGARAAVAEGTTACGNPADPASGVTVDLLLNGQVVQSTATDAEGHFRFTGLAAGDYVIRVTLPSGTISAPAIVQAGQTTTITGEFDRDCNDVDDDGDPIEVSLRVREDTSDGSELEGDLTEEGGRFHGQVREGTGSVRRERGSRGDRSDERDDDGSAGGEDKSSSSSGGTGDRSLDD